MTVKDIPMLYLKTEAGRLELHGKQHALTAHQRQVLILCDGERTFDELVQMMPPTSLASALERLCNLGLLVSRAAPARTASAAQPEPWITDPAQRYRASVDLVTRMASDLGFTARLKTQLQIERATTLDDLAQLGAGLCDALPAGLKSAPQTTARLHRLRELTQT